MSRFAGLLKETFKAFSEDKVPRVGAALAYYTIFSIGPLLLIAVAMSGLFFGQEAAQGKISVIDVAISAMGGYVSQYVGGEAVAYALSLATSFAVAVVLFAAIFRILPDLKIAWRDVWLGAVITAVLFVVGKWGVGVYLGKAAPGSAYGADGSLVILLIWVYWSAQILFLGAEFTQVYARSFGSLAERGLNGV